MSRVFEIAVHAVPWLVGFVSFGWLFWHRLKRSEDPGNILYKIILSLAVIGCEILLVRSMAGSGNIGEVFLAASSLGVCALILSIVWAPQISRLFVSPLNIFDGGNMLHEPKPYYSIAIAKRKGNKPLEAVAGIREHLAKCPDDFEGVILLAHIQAEDLKDLPSAEKTLNHFCEWGQASREQVAVVFTQLADWHLKFYRSVSSAKAALQRIVDKYPGTEEARTARERIAHLDGGGKGGNATS